MCPHVTHSHLTNPLIFSLSLEGSGCPASEGGRRSRDILAGGHVNMAQPLPAQDSDFSFSGEAPYSATPKLGFCRRNGSAPGGGLDTYRPCRECPQTPEDTVNAGVFTAPPSQRKPGTLGLSQAQYHSREKPGRRLLFMCKGSCQEH